MQFDGSGNLAGVVFNTATVAKPNAFQISLDNAYDFIISGYFSGEKLVFGSSTLYGHPTFSPLRLFVAKSGGILTGLQSNTASSALTIFPIPSASEIVFTSENNRIQKITLFDLSGKQVAHKNCTDSKEELSLVGLSAGIYMARVETQDHQINTVKVVKVE